MIAILGASGQLGSAFMRLLEEKARPVYHSDLDLGNSAAVKDWVGRTKPDVIINCAAFTAVDAAEDEESTARQINAIAVGDLARAAARTGSRFVTFSTDYVFDGTKTGPYSEDDPPNPLSSYGRTKLEGERLALEENPTSLIIRTSWVLSGTHPNFATTMLRLIRSGEVRVVNDQHGRPTMVDDLAAATMECVESELSGVLHACNQGETTWFDLARSIAAAGGLDPSRVNPCSSNEFPRPAPRPANSVLSTERLESLGITPLPHFEVSLPGVVRSLIERGY